MYKAMYKELSLLVSCTTAIIIISFKIKPTYCVPSVQCDLIFNILPNPYICCNYPKFLIPRSIVNECTNDCKGTKNTCCSYLCIPQKSRTFVDGKLNQERIKKYFVKGIDEQELDVVKNLWKLVIGRAMDECVNRFPESRNIGKCMPSSYSNTIECIKLENFLRCPNYNQTEECLEVKDNLNSCFRNSTIF
ncbi:hypothetical protein ACKWTF_015849 [Chironomus riparius]